MTMDTSTLVAAVTGIFLPLAIAYIVGRNAPPSFKATFAFAACVVAAVLVTILVDGWQTIQAHSANDVAKLILVNVLATLLTAWNLFARLYHPTGAVGALEAAGPQLGAPSPPAP